MDQYSICLCGSGKKIKFCKCAPHLQEMLKVMRMIEGEQLVAALDRVNHLLKAQPNEAWLLATRCRILFMLDEREGLEEASARFIRLQPDNSLAKIFRSIVATWKGSMEEGCNMLVQSIADANGTLDALYIHAHSQMILILWQLGYYLSAVAHAKLLNDIAGESVERARYPLQSLLHEARAPALFREDLPSKPDEVEEAWSERYEEANALFESFRVNQAKAKLEAILREFGPKPAVLNMLISCKVLLADVTGAMQHALKLSQDASLSEVQRIFFLALAMKLDPVASRSSVTVNLVEVEVPDEARLVETLLSHESLRSGMASDEAKREVASACEQEVLPKHIFDFYEETVLPDESRVKYRGAWFAVFGKQTDRPAMLIFTEAQYQRSYEEMRRTLKDLGLDLEGAKCRPIANLQLGENYLVGSTFLDSENRVVSMRSASLDLKQAVVAKAIDVPIKCLNGLTISEAARDPQHHIAIKAILLNILDSIIPWIDRATIRELHQKLGLSYPQVNGDEDVQEEVGSAAHFWVDLDAISEQSFMVYLQSALSLNLVSMFSEYVRACEQREWRPEIRDRIAFLKSIILSRLSVSPQDLVARLMEAYDFGRKLNLNIGSIGIQVVQILFTLQQVNQASVMMQRLIEDFPNDPAVQGFIAEIVGSLRESRSKRQVGPSLDQELAHQIEARRSRPSGLWTPDGPSPDPVAAPSSESSGSKLWVPGMD